MPLFFLLGAIPLFKKRYETIYLLVFLLQQGKKTRCLRLFKFSLIFLFFQHITLSKKKPLKIEYFSKRIVEALKKLIGQETSIPLKGR